MASKSTVCMSCGRKGPSVSFTCPNPACSGTPLVRCNACKENENPYSCPTCNFTGP